MEHHYKNISIHYEILGSGENLLVFLHGWGMNSKSMKALQEQFTFYNDNYTYLFIDFPPFGRSEEPISPWILNDYVKLTEEIILSLNSEGATSIIAHSFGGRVALKLAAKTDINVDKLVLFSPAGIKPRFSIRTKIKIWKYKFYKHIKSKKVENFGSKDYRILSPVMKKTFKNIINEDLTSICKKIKAKTLIMFGNKDKETPLYMGKIMRNNIANSKLVIIKNGDHFTYFYNANSIFPTVYSFINFEIT